MTIVVKKMKSDSPIGHILFKKEYFEDGSPLFQRQIDLVKAMYKTEDFNSKGSLKALISKVVNGDREPSGNLYNGIIDAISNEVKQRSPHRSESLMSTIKQDFKIALTESERNRGAKEKRILTISSGFILFATPIVEVVREALQNDDEDFSVALYGKRSNDYHPDFNTIEPPKESHRLYYANDLLRMLELSKVDAICVVGPIYHEKNQAFKNLIPIRIATVVNTKYSGVYVQVFSRNEKLKNAIKNNQFDWNTLKKSLDKQRMPLFYFEGTLSQLHLDMLFQAKQLINYFKTIPIPEGDKQSSLKEPFSEWFEEYGFNPETFGFIGWEPLVSWYCKQFEEHDCIKVPLSHIVDDSALPYFEFSLVVRKDFIESESGLTLVEVFIQKLRSAIDRITSNAFKYSHEFEQLASFFHMNPTALMAELDKINFDVKYYPEFTEHIIKRVS